MRWLLVITVFAVCATSSASAATYYLLGPKWHGNAPLTIKVDSSSIIDSGYITAIAAAEQNWSASDAVDLVPVSKAKIEIKLDTEGYCPSYAYACTPYQARNGYFSGATILITPFGQNADAWVKQAIICHELGHALGLNHQPTSDTCLHASLGDSIANTPNALDFEELDYLYGG